MRHRRGATLLVAAVLTAGLLGGAPITLARFTGSVNRSASFGTATLQPPTALTGTGGASVGLSWTASSSTGASGYNVLKSATSGSGYSQIGSVTPVTATATTDAPAAGTWYYVLRTYFASWTSATSNEVSVVVAGGPTSTGPVQCSGTSNAAETTNAGDNNGYESLPANACAVDGSVATDGSTGTGGANSCTASTKDKHRWWGYAFGLPATVTSINGITVAPVAGMNNNGGETWLCVQLSWDGGTSWTAAKNVVLSGTGLAAYSLGGTADTWGRTWAPADFSSASFRVRVIDSTTQPNKDVRLDGLGVSVAYTP